MLGRKVPDKPAAAPQSPDNGHTDSLDISKGGFFNGNVLKIDEHDAEKGAAHQVYLVDEKRVGQHK
jgi:hypothetical protein